MSFFLLQFQHHWQTFAGNLPKILPKDVPQEMEDGGHEKLLVRDVGTVLRDSKLVKC